MSLRTEIEWGYEPADFFESPWRHNAATYNLNIDAGKALIALASPTDPVPDSMLEDLDSAVRTAFLVRQIQTHRTFHLHGPTVNQHGPTARSITVHFGSAACVLAGVRADIVLTDSTGRVLHDSRAERIAYDQAEMDLLWPRIGRSPVLGSLLKSYAAAVNDPADELIHLYEVRDALTSHFGSESAARQALNISKNQWQRIGQLTSAEPLEQGRHRGKHITRRPATRAELNEARQIVRQWILAFARKIP